MNTILSGSLLAASLMLAQPAAVPKLTPLGESRINIEDTAPTPLQQVQAKTPMPGQRPFVGWFQREEKPILSKMQNWFKPYQPDRNGPAPTFLQPARGGVIRETAPTPIVPAPPINDFPRKLPNPATQLKAQPTSMARDLPYTPKNVQQTTNYQPGYMPKNIQSPIHPQFADKIGRDDRFEWITGQLEVENNNLVIYYATPETVDKYHGRVFLIPQKDELNAFRRGDLISVRGQLLQRPTAQGIVPVYRVEQAHPIERPRQ